MIPPAVIYSHGMNHALLSQTIQDLHEDSRILEYLQRDYAQKIKRNRIKNLTENIEQEMQAVGMQIGQFKKSLRTIDELSLPHTLTIKQDIIARLHRVSGFIGQAVTTTHWQSPAADQSVIDSVGTRKGKILAHFNDYTRDQHALGVAFEKQYRAAYIPLPYTIPVFAFATVSGMAAMITAALFVQGLSPQDAHILIGKSCYFETKQLLQKMFGKRAHEVDATDNTALQAAINRYQPSAVFVDTIGNEPAMTVIDIPKLIEQLRTATNQKLFLIVDTSTTSFMTKCIHGVTLPKNITLLGVESQNKFLQFGLDRVTAGVVWGTGFISQQLHDYRDHAGLNCPDSTIATLPTPNRAIATIHIRRIERNTKHIVERFSNHAKKNIMMIYPTGLGFSGGYCILYWKTTLLRSYKRYIERVMAHAKKSNYPLVHGTSFGFTTTRIYTVAMHTHYERPFLRIAPGTETAIESEKLAELFLKCL